MCSGLIWINALEVHERWFLGSGFLLENLLRLVAVTDCPRAAVGFPLPGSHLLVFFQVGCLGSFTVSFLGA